MTDETQEPVKDMAALRREFAEWYMHPFHGTQRAWAEEHGVREETLSRWKADPDFNTLLTNWRERGKVAIPAMFAAVVQRVIEKGDPIAYRAVMETLGESKQEIDLNLSGPFIKLQEQLIAIRKAAMEQEQPRTN